MVSTSRKLDVPLGCSTCEGSLEKTETNGITYIRIQKALEMICHHVGLRIFFCFPIEFRTIAQDLGRNWSLVWQMKNWIIHNERHIWKL